MKVYLAGPMSGRMQFNYPAFNAMAGELRKVVVNPGEHIEVVSPPELDSPPIQQHAMTNADGVLPSWAPTHGTLVGLGVQRIIDGKFDAVVVLPEWETSKGARCEVMAGLASGAKICKVDYAYGNRPYLYQMPRGEMLRGLEGEE